MNFGSARKNIKRSTQAYAEINDEPTVKPDPERDQYW